jgi:hypothetical protein
VGALVGAVHRRCGVTQKHSVAALRGRRYRLGGTVYRPQKAATIIDVPERLFEEGITLQLDIRR